MKRFFLSIICLMTILGSYAQQKSHFTQLDWTEMSFDSILPSYTETIPLESDYRLHTYQVSIEYPEYAPLSEQESREILKFDSLIGDTIHVEQSLGVSRRVGMLDISFVPVIKRNGKYQKLLSAQILINPIPHARRRAQLASSQAQTVDHSVLSKGKWVKISITKDGIYALTRSSLKKMGFSDISRVHLYGYGGHRQPEIVTQTSHYNDLQEVALYRASEDTWLFWGKGLVHWEGDNRILNHYANEACYFLTEGEVNEGIEDEPSSTATPVFVFNTFADHVLYEKDEYAWFSTGNQLVENFNFASTGSRTYNLKTTNSAGGERLFVKFTASSTKSTSMTPTVNGSDLPSVSLSPIVTYVYATEVKKTYSVSHLRAEDDNWTVKLSSTLGHDARLDYLALHYNRNLVVPAEDGFVAFSGTGNSTSAFDISCKPTSTRVLRVDSPGKKSVNIEGTAKSESQLRVTVDNPSVQYVAFDITHAFPEPSYVSQIENQDLHAMDSLDMVILIPSNGNFAAEATRLAEAHLQYDSLRVAVVRADQVYNEFSSGTPDATAYRRFMKMLYDKSANLSTAPRYLLLMGDCAWDNRMISTGWRNYSPKDYLLSYQSDNSYSDTQGFVMEEYFGLLDDGEGDNLLTNKADLGVGRFPVTSVAEAKVMVDKTIDYMSKQHAGAWKNLVFFLGDDGDENQHMDYANRVADRVRASNPELEVRKVMWDTYPRVSTPRSNTYPEVMSLLKRQMDEGALVFNYTGHANAVELSHEFVLGVNDFVTTTGTALPLWVTAACDVTPFDGLSPNMGEAALLNPHGGALAFYGTTRTVYSSQNLYMNRYFMQYLFGTDSKGERYRLGDAVRLSKNSIISGGMESIYKENKLHYVLLGDPALIIGAPLERVVLDSINGSPVSSQSSVGLKAGQRVRLVGHVEDAKKSLLSDFQGVLTTRLYDNEETIVCRNNANVRREFTYTDRSSMLYEAQDSIRGGRFELHFMIPIDINYSDETGRLVFYAIDDAHAVEANGYYEQFRLGGIETNATDTVGPLITAYLNHEEFQDGDVVNASPFFVAQLSDTSGINTSGNGIGHDLILCIDNQASSTYVLNAHFTPEFGDFTKGTVAFSIPELPDGPHTLTFRAWDLLNNTSTYSMDFVVNHKLAPQLLQVTASQNPAITSTNFLVSCDFPGSQATVTIDVYDFSGRRIWTTSHTGVPPSGTYSIPWNLSTGAGGRLGSGVYFYRCRIQSGESKKVSKTQKIIVLNNK